MVTIKQIVQLINRSLEIKYNIDLIKFDVENLVINKKKVRSDLLTKFQNKLTDKVNINKKDIQKMQLDFGPYPMNRIWRKGTRIEDEDNNGIIFPPDEDNYDKHGQDNLVLKYRDNKAILEIDSILHKQSDFYKRKHLEGELESFVADLNDYLEPLRD